MFKLIVKSLGLT